MAVPQGKPLREGREKGFDMTKKLLALVIGAAVALCIGLVGCSGSGGGGGSASPEQDLPGVWDIQNVDELLTASMGDAGTTMSDDVKKKAAEIFPSICFMNINADGTFQLVAMTESVEGKWELKGDEITLTAQDSPVTGKLADNTITIEAGGTKMVFAKTGDQARAVPTEDELQSKLMELAMAAMG